MHGASKANVSKIIICLRKKNVFCMEKGEIEGHASAICLLSIVLVLHSVNVIMV